MKHAGLFPLFSWLIGLVVFIIGVSNLLLVHPVPGIVFLMLSALYFPPADLVLIHIFFCILKTAKLSCKGCFYS